MAKKQTGIVHAKDCPHSDKTQEVYEKILLCKVKQANNEKIIGCHSQIKCEFFYKKRISYCEHCKLDYGLHYANCPTQKK